ncbi:MAG TPA: DMT family transporter [Rhizobacter sp.]|nr:DMT family transporter [Rhizobacter sp.]
MKAIDLLELTGLAALWGASFLFMRLGAGEFGPVALAAVRVVGASLCLLPLLWLKGQWPDLRRHWRAIFLVGITNSALPFLCFSYAALTVPAGLSAIFNATTPLFGAVIARLWLKDRLTPSRIVGLMIGFAGVLWLVWHNVNSVMVFAAGGQSSSHAGWATSACLAATVLYGFSASFTKRFLTGVAPLAVAAGSQVSASLLLAIPAVLWWPATMPAGRTWLAALTLAVACTALAYVMFFRLIAHIGPAHAISVTFLIPMFAVLWGWTFLHESISPTMALGCLVIVVGTSLATGFLKLPSRSGVSAGQVH